MAEVEPSEWLVHTGLDCKNVLAIVQPPRWGNSVPYSLMGGRGGMCSIGSIICDVGGWLTNIIDTHRLSYSSSPTGSV